MNITHSSGETNIVLLLGILLIITNLKPIVLYRDWLYFKISTILKQYLNERKNKTN